MKGHTSTVCLVCGSSRAYEYKLKLDATEKEALDCMVYIFTGVVYTKTGTG